MISQGMTSTEHMMPIQAFVIGCLRLYLSLIIPPNMAEVKPMIANDRAFTLANASLKPGYTY